MAADGARTELEAKEGKTAKLRSSLKQPATHPQDRNHEPTQSPMLAPIQASNHHDFIPSPPGRRRNSTASFPMYGKRHVSISEDDEAFNKRRSSATHVFAASEPLSAKHQRRDLARAVAFVGLPPPPPLGSESSGSVAAEDNENEHFDAALVRSLAPDPFEVPSKNKRKPSIPGGEDLTYNAFSRTLPTHLRHSINSTASAHLVNDSSVEDYQFLPLPERHLLAQKIKRLVSLQRRCDEYRERVRDLRDKAEDQRNVAQQYFERLEKALPMMFVRDPRELRSSEGEEMALVRGLFRQAIGSWKQLQKVEDKLHSAGSRLRSREYEMEQQELNLLAALRPLMHGFDDSESEDSLSQQVTEESQSITENSQSDDDDNAHPVARHYVQIIGRITNLRERLPELELGYRSQIFEENGSVSRMKRRATFDEYFSRRIETVGELLRSIDEAFRIRKGCIQKGLLLEDLGAKNQLEEALKYDVGRGEIGRMYRLHWHPGHRGMRPIELLLIPFAHSDDRISEWRLQTHLATSWLDINTAERETRILPMGKPFEFPPNDVDGDDLENGSIVHFAESEGAPTSTVFSAGEAKRTWWAGSLNADTQSEPGMGIFICPRKQGFGHQDRWRFQGRMPTDYRHSRRSRPCRFKRSSFSDTDEITSYPLSFQALDLAVPGLRFDST